MRIINLLILFCAFCSRIQAQTTYNFTKSTHTYNSLSGATSLNNNQIWDSNDFGPVQLPFNIQIFGINYTHFTFEDDNFKLHTSSNMNISDEIEFFPFAIYAQDRNISGTSNSISPISYKVEGNSGNQILKLELNNAGLELENENQGTTNYYFNYQIWLYEFDKSIEYHFGNHNLTNTNLLNDEGALFSGFIYEGNLTEGMGFVHNNINAPLYSEVTDLENPPLYLSALPTPNTVFRFSPSNSASTEEFYPIQVSLYPNPAKEKLNISFKNTINSKYEICDLNGKVLINGKTLNNEHLSIDISTFSEGIYIFKVENQIFKFIKN